MAALVACRTPFAAHRKEHLPLSPVSFLITCLLTFFYFFLRFSRLSTNRFTTHSLSFLFALSLSLSISVSVSFSFYSLFSRSSARFPPYITSPLRNSASRLSTSATTILRRRSVCARPNVISDLEVSAYLGRARSPSSVFFSRSFTQSRESQFSRASGIAIS